MKTAIAPHHQRAIDKLTEAYQDDPRFLALIIGGSVAKGMARNDSDVDFLIVATDEAFQSQLEKKDLFINRKDLTDYPGGFVDGKIIDLNYLQALAQKGNEPSRAAFDGAFLAYSHVKELTPLLEQIPVYPEAERETRMQAFYTMAFIQHWLMGEAERHDNLYTKTKAASQLVLFAGRAILAHNRVLYPYHKWFLRYLEKCEEKPDGFMEQIQELLHKPSLETATNLFRSLRQFKDWGLTDHEAFMWFMTKVEWGWLEDNSALEDL